MFESYITDNSTIKILDRYLESNEQHFLILDSFKILYKNVIYNINFIISNKIEIGKQIVSTNITLTTFKEIYKPVFNDCDKIINYKNYVSATNKQLIPKFTLPVLDFIDEFYCHFKQHIEESVLDNIIFFNNPISINAQSSKNRMGYGNEYYYNILVHEGIKYGETSQFPIVGYKCCVNENLTKIFCF